MEIDMKNKIVILLLISLLWAHFVNAQDSVRLNKIDSTLREYGHQQTVANKISIVSVSLVLGGTLIRVPAIPLLVGTSLCDLATIIVSSKANKNLSKHANNTKHK
jgi:Na+/H+ antiporter NhaC